MRYKNKKLEFYILFFIIILMMMIYNIGTPPTPDLLKIRVVPKEISGMFLAAAAISMFLFSSKIGSMGDKYGMKKIFALMPIGYGIIQLIFAYSGDVYIMLLARFLAGIFLGGSVAISYAYATYLSNKDDRTGNIFLVSAGISIGASLGYGLSGFIMRNVDIIKYIIGNNIEEITYSYLFQFIFGIILAIFIILLLNETNKVENKENESILSLFTSFKYIYQLSYKLKIYALFMFLSEAGGVLSSSLAIIYVLDYYNILNSTGIATMLTISSLITFIGLLIIKKITYKVEEIKLQKNTLTIALILLIFLSLLMKYNRITFIIIILLIIYNIVYEVDKALANTIMMKLSKNDKEPGKVLGLSTSVLMLGKSAGFVISGYLISTVSLTFIINFIILLVCFILLMYLKKLIN